MFDLKNLNDYEFECLCQDVMQKKLGVKLHIFSRGVDQGVDVCDSKLNPKIVIQAKHYCNSSYSQLKSSLKNEILKVKKLNPKCYYVFTSLTLSRSNKNEIVELFNEYMPNISYIIDKSEIDNFLSNENNNDVVLKNYKLWLCASNVLSLINDKNVFIDCCELMADIEKQVDFFVETTQYKEALEKLNKDNVIIIVGGPGVGKSTISKMILLYAVNEEYTVRYVSNNNIASLKNVLSLDPEKKEILLLDDFLGQHYLNIKETQTNELRTLISFVERHKNKKLILNSRITIINEAREKFLTFKNVIEDNGNKKYLIDLDKLSEQEKALILYNHMYFNELPLDFFSCIKKNKTYSKIVKHKNYNPRIIEYVTKHINHDLVEPKNYIKYIFDNLDNPRDVWSDEYRNRLDIPDRILLNTMYSLGDNFISKKVLQEAFLKRVINDSRIDTTVDCFNDTISRLNTSLIKIVEDSGDLKISVVNPSVNDFLKNYITENEAEQIAVLNNAFYLEQIDRILMSEESKNDLIKKMYNGDFFKLKCLENSPYYYFIKYIVKFNLKDPKLNEYLILSLSNAHNNLNYFSRESYGSFILKLFTSDFSQIYGTNKILNSPLEMRNIFQYLRLDSAIAISNLIANKLDLNKNDELKELIQRQLKSIITFKIADDVNEEAYDIARNIIDSYEENINGNYDEIKKDLWEEIEILFNSKVIEYTEQLNDYFSETVENTIDFNSEKHFFDVEFTLNQVINFSNDGSDSDWSSSETTNENSDIAAIFER